MNLANQWDKHKTKIAVTIVAALLAGGAIPSAVFVAAYCAVFACG